MTDDAFELKILPGCPLFKLHGMWVTPGWVYWRKDCLGEWMERVRCRRGALTEGYHDWSEAACT